MRYEEDARALWQTYVPKRGQADTVQGELMRAVEKLRDEAQRNGNINWGKNHVLLAEYLRDTLTRSGLFDEAATAEIQRDVARLLDYNYPDSGRRYRTKTDRRGAGVRPLTARAVQSFPTWRWEQRGH